MTCVPPVSALLSALQSTTPWKSLALITGDLVATQTALQIAEEMHLVLVAEEWEERVKATPLAARPAYLRTDLGPGERWQG